MAKVLIVLDHKRQNYYQIVNHKPQPVYFMTKAGKQLVHLIRMKSGLNIPSLKGVHFTFAYPFVPQVNSQGQDKKITKHMILQHKDKLEKEIVTLKPKLIVGMGQVANQALFPKGNITKNRGDPKEITYTYQGQSYKVPVLVTFNLESTEIMPYKKGLIKVDFHVGNEILHKKHFHIGVDLSRYKYITNFKTVKKIFQKINGFKALHMVAVDTETNSLKPWNKGSKIIVFSLSWQRNQGVCIPFLHKDTPWNAHQIKLIRKWLIDYMMSDHYKVFHNGKYDIKFMMLTLGLPYAKNCVDTLLMHYVGVTEEQTVSRGLKVLAIDYTSMGDYSAPLKKYKQNKERQHYANFLKYYHHNHVLYRQHKTNKKILKKDYKPLRNPIDGGGFNYEWIPLHILAPYAAMDTDATLRLYYVFRNCIIKHNGWIRLIYSLYPRLENSLARMEANGMHISMKQVNKLKPAYAKGIKQALSVVRKDPYVSELQDYKLGCMRKYEREMKKPKSKRNTKILHKYHRYVGRQKDPLENIRFNPNSTDDVKRVLFEYAGYQLPFDKDYMTSTAQKERLDKKQWGDLKWYSAGKQSLNYCVKHYHSHFCKALLKYKKLYKLYDDFICKLPKMRDNHDLIHPKFIMSGTVTHRLASRNPNAQQIPAGTTNPHEFDFYYPIKSMFTSRFKGGTITNYDFKSFEIFVVTALCGEPNLVSALCNGYDAHKTNASRAFDVPYDKVTPQQRQEAKKVSFGTLYSISVGGLADQLHKSKDYAQKVMNKVLGSLPVLKKYSDYVHAFAKKNKYVETIDGFRRRLKRISSPNFAARNRADRESLNAVVQGSTVAYIGRAIELIQQVFHKRHMRTKLICTVHDSVLSDSPANETREATHIAIHIMQNLPMASLNKFKVKDYKNIPKKLWNGDGTFHFPFISNAATGNSYGQLVPFDYKHLGKVKISSYTLYFKLAYSKVCVDNYLTYGVINQKKHDEIINKLNKIIDMYCMK